MTSQDINSQLETMLSGRGIAYKITLIGDTCPPFCEDIGKPGIGVYPRRAHIHGRHYRLMLETQAQAGVGSFRYPAKTIAVDFWNSYHDAELEALGCACYRRGGVYVKYCSKHPRPKVTVADVLACSQLSEVGTFNYWASEYGYDTDSRRAHHIWEACSIQYEQFRAMFGPDELRTIEELVREL